MIDAHRKTKGDLFDRMLEALDAAEFHASKTGAPPKVLINKFMSGSWIIAQIIFNNIFLITVVASLNSSRSNDATCLNKDTSSGMTFMYFWSMTPLLC